MSSFDLDKTNSILDEIKKIRVYAYIRVSHIEQVLKGYSLQAQREALEDYAQKNNMIIVDWFIDDGKTARTKLKKRKEMQRLLMQTEKKEADQIIFIKLDRWVRNISDYYDIEKILDKNGFTWKTTQEEYDNSTREGRLKINLNLTIAQDESDRTSERIKFVNESKVKKGGVVTGRVPYGYKIVEKDKMKILVKDEEKELIVEEIFEHFSTHQSQMKTYNYVVEKYGFPLHYRAISQLLKKEIYTGRYRENDNFCEPYISQKEFIKIREILKKNIKVGKNYDTYLFSKMFRCPNCGRPKTGRNSKRKYKEKYRYYSCNYRDITKGCRTYPEKVIENYLLKNINEELKKHKYKLEVSKKEEIKNMPQVDVKSIKEEMKRLNKQYRKGRIDDDEYEKEYTLLENALKRYDAQHTVFEPNLEAIQQVLNEDFPFIYETLTREEKRTLWRSIIKSMHVIDYDNIQIDFI